jgi:hypothetical protein
MAVRLLSLRRCASCIKEDNSSLQSDGLHSSSVSVCACVRACVCVRVSLHAHVLLSLSLACARALSLPPSLSISLSSPVFSLARSLALCSISFARTVSRNVSFTHALYLFRSHCVSQCLFLRLARSRTLSLARARSRSLSLSRCHLLSP